MTARAALGISAWLVVALAGRPALAAAPHGSGDTGPWALLDEYCVSCHNTTDWAGELALDAQDRSLAAIPADAETWEKVIRRMRGRLMPPPGESRPSTQKVDAFVHWLEGRIDEAALQHVEAGHVPLHRLNRREYANAIRELFALEFDPAALLPQDDLSDGFDNVAKVLQVSPTFLDQYLAAARSVAQQAVGNPGQRPVGTPYTNPLPGPQHNHVEGLPFGTRGGFAVDHIFPADGEYELNINDMARALWVEGMEFENVLVALVDGVKIYETRLGGNDDQKAIDQKGDAPVDAINRRLKNIRFQAKAGQHQVAVTFRAKSYAESDARLQSLIPGGGEERVLKVNSFEIRGPFTTSGVSETPSRQSIFSCYPDSAAEELPCAQQIAARIAQRAFRRPLREGEVGGLLQAFVATRSGTSFDEGVRALLTRILASPDFLYRSVETPAGVKPGESFPLPDLALASRLSFFLWSSLPDEELLQAAAAGRLGDEQELARQVQRMLADPRAASLANDFAYQWLGLGKLSDIEPDPNVFPYAAPQRDVTGDLREELREEVRLFVDDVFRNDRSVLDLMQGEYTFLNERLAVHYDMRDVKGSHFRRVRLTDPNRFGLLGKAGVLMVSSYPNRTAPVLRGAWILDNITGTPPTPPPPGVEALKDPVPGGKVLTMREQMAAHSTQKNCHACHGVLDPLGLALENFDGVGRWREKDRLAGTRIDATGVLPDGTPVNGPVDLRNALMRNPDQFVQTLVIKMMTYATGRPMEWHDMPVIRAIVKEAAADDYRFGALLLAIVKSAPFRMQQVPAEDKTPGLQAAVTAHQ
jgi:mono/diheme cytochrome c family protein